MKAENISHLLNIMARLRNPEGGCAWDLQQTFDSIAPYTIEEAYEVADAIEKKDMDGLKDELGDLLLQVVFHAQMAKEKGYFDFNDVVDAISDKMVRRHPHVFSGEEQRDAEAQSNAWETQKAQERAAKNQHQDTPLSALDDLTHGLPALMRAVKLQKRAARVGFDWPEISQVLDKLQEELGELSEEIVTRSQNGANEDRILDEFGDVLFVYANLARHLNIDPEAALRSTNWKFERRFRAIEQYLWSKGRRPEDCSLAELDQIWNTVKAEEHKA
ncbi:MAG: nucleoside triphosphate pyrophosphohydrolase [Kordiimonas sp.]|nr:nucleoside triphosphate pyrophosphohydrolase [Kordiimonas sp.]|tara:strand:- start:5852 stop:6673 length:822 start_codon:yes stop_codon:yes gene_type:complete